MAETISNANDLQRITANAVAAKVTQINLPEDAKYLRAQFFDAAGTAEADGYFALAGQTDGVAVTGDYIYVLTGQGGYGRALGYKLGENQITTVYVGSTIASGIIVIETSEVPV